MAPSWLKTMQRLEVVPWSIAATYFSELSVMATPGAGSEGCVVDEATQYSADQRADDQDPRVAPVGTSLVRHRQDGVDDARAELTRRVDGIARAATQGHADADGQERHEEDRDAR